MKRTQMRRVSKGQARDNAQYRKRIKAFIEGFRFCPVMYYVQGSRCRPNQVHHTKGRDGDLLLDERFWMAVCERGHRKINEEPKWAQKCGFRFTKGYGLHDQLEAKICERRRLLDFYKDEEYEQLMKDIHPEFEK
jgi:hypothetical protein